MTNFRINTLETQAGLDVPGNVVFPYRGFDISFAAPRQDMGPKEVRIWKEGADVSKEETTSLAKAVYKDRDYFHATAEGLRDAMAAIDIYHHSLPTGTRLIDEQREWIKKCGGDLAGYLKKYGSKEDPDFARWPRLGYSGEGGEAIYNADRGELSRLEFKHMMTKGSPYPGTEFTVFYHNHELAEDMTDVVVWTGEEDYPWVSLDESIIEGRFEGFGDQVFEVHLGTIRLYPEATKKD